MPQLRSVTALRFNEEHWVLHGRPASADRLREQIRLSSRKARALTRAARARDRAAVCDPERASSAHSRTNPGELQPSDRRPVAGTACDHMDWVGMRASYELGRARSTARPGSPARGRAMVLRRAGHRPWRMSEAVPTAGTVRVDSRDRRALSVSRGWPCSPTLVTTFVLVGVALRTHRLRICYSWWDMVWLILSGLVATIRWLIGVTP